MAEEPKFQDTGNTYSFPDEPGFAAERQTSASDSIPRIVPAETEAIPYIDNSAQNQAREAARRQMMSQVAGDFIPPQINAPGSTWRGSYDYNEYYDDEDEGSSHHFLRSIIMIICLALLLVGAWQVTLFIQPSFLSNDLLRGVTTESCKYLYCPPIRELALTSTSVRPIEPGKWQATMQIQNSDTRTQDLPAIELTMDTTDGSIVQMTFKPSDYVVLSRATSLKGGAAEDIEISFDYAEKLPSSFSWRIIEN